MCRFVVLRDLHSFPTRRSSDLADGSLDQQTAFVQHQGSSVHPRQDKPYAHWIRTDPTNKFALVADLGTDKIVVYRFDAKDRKSTRLNSSHVSISYAVFCLKKKN